MLEAILVFLLGETICNLLIVLCVLMAFLGFAKYCFDQLDRKL